MRATGQTIDVAVPAGWQPRTEAELETAAANALLQETHHLDIKRELRQPGSGVNRELARDLASFAVDGGLIIIGIDEQANRPILNPVPLSGLAERVEQIALTAIDPPLLVESQPIEAANRPGHGYLVVTIPTSPTPPHMVDGRYWGRGDKTKYSLSDGEVSRLHRLRQGWERDAVTMLDPLLAADPVPVELRQQAHLFVLAVPVAGRRTLLLDALPDGGSPQALLQLVHKQALPLAGVNADAQDGFAPHLGAASQFELRPAGWALTSYRFLPGRVLPPDADEGGLVELELDEDGTLRAFCGRASAKLSRSGQDVVFERLVIGVTRQFLAVARIVSDTAGHWGSWDLAVALTGLRGKGSFIADYSFGLRPSPYAGDEYKEGTRASIQELKARPGHVADRLLGRFVRALGTRNHPSVASLLD